MPNSPVTHDDQLFQILAQLASQISSIERTIATKEDIRDLRQALDNYVLKEVFTAELAQRDERIHALEAWREQLFTRVIIITGVVTGVLTTALHYLLHF